VDGATSRLMTVRFIGMVAPSPRDAKIRSRAGCLQ
jgi:hypothetical protein